MPKNRSGQCPLWECITDRLQVAGFSPLQLHLKRKAVPMAASQNWSDGQRPIAVIASHGKLTLWNVEPPPNRQQKPISLMPVADEICFRRFVIPAGSRMLERPTKGATQAGSSLIRVMPLPFFRQTSN